eukprot:g42095.t1
MDRLNDHATEKEKTLDKIIKSDAKAQHQDSGFAATASIAVDKGANLDSILKSAEKAAHQDSGFAATASIAVDKGAKQDSILKSAEKAHHQGAGFGAAGSIAVEKEAYQDSILKSGVKAQHQGATLISGGSIAIDKGKALDGINRGGKAAEGPIASSADEIKNAIKGKIAGKQDAALEKAVLDWLAAAAGTTVAEGKSFQQALADGKLICHGWNKVYPKDAVGVSEGKMAFHHRENIANFCKGLVAKKFSVTFEPEDLIDSVDLPKVAHVLAVLCNYGHKTDPSLPALAYAGTMPAGGPGA